MTQHHIGHDKICFWLSAVNTIPCRNLCYSVCVSSLEESIRGTVIHSLTDLPRQPQSLGPYWANSWPSYPPVAQSPPAMGPENRSVWIGRCDLTSKTNLHQVSHISCLPYISPVIRDSTASHVLLTCNMLWCPVTDSSQKYAPLLTSES